MPVMRIKELREAAGMSQAALGIRMGVVQGAIGNWEAEVALPKTRDLPRLAAVFGCKIDELFAPCEESQEPEPEPDYYNTPEEE